MENFTCLDPEMVRLSCGMEFLANASEQYRKRTMEPKLDLLPFREAGK